MPPEVGALYFLGDLHFVAYLCASLDHRVIIRFFSFKKSFLEDQQGNDTRGNGCIGYIKYRAEKSKSIAPYKREPGWKMFVLQDREIKHIHHPSMQESSITMLRKTLGHLVIRTLIKNQSVKHTVNKVTKRPCIN